MLGTTGSFVLGGNVCNGTISVHLQNEDGTPFFDSFDICGGTVQGLAGYSETGPQNGSTNCQLTNFRTEGGRHCFDLSYFPIDGQAQSDEIVIQPTDAANNPVGNAIVLPLSFNKCDESCNCDNDLIFTYAQNSGDLCVTLEDLGLSGEDGCNCTISAVSSSQSPPAFTFFANNSGCVLFSNSNNMSSAADGDYEFTYTSTCNGIQEANCKFIVRVGGFSTIDCINTATSTFNVTANQIATAGDFVQFRLNINPNSGGLGGYFVKMKDPSGNFMPIDPEFQSADSSGQLWRWQVPDNCPENGNYEVCVFPPDGGVAGCPSWTPNTPISVSGCDDKDDCSGFPDINVNCGSTVTLSAFFDNEDGSPFLGTPSISALNGTVSNIQSAGGGNWQLNYSAPNCGTVNADEIFLSWTRSEFTTPSCRWQINVLQPGQCSDILQNPTISQVVSDIGDQVTLGGDGCDCDGLETNWYQTSGPVGGAVITKISGNESVVNYLQSGNYTFAAKCCEIA